MRSRRPEVGPAIRRIRRHKMLTQRKLAKRAGVTPSMVSAYERGRRLPSFENLDALMRALGENLCSLELNMRYARYHRVR